MARERKEFTPEEERRIGIVVNKLVKGGENAIDALRDERYQYMLLEYTVGKKTSSIQDMEAAGGRIVDLANEAINRAQSIIEDKGEDRVSLVQKEIDKVRGSH